MSRNYDANVLVVQNDANGGPRRLATWLESDGLRLDVRHPYGPHTLPERLSHKGLIVLGGGFLPDADAKAPWLARTRQLAAQALDEGMPMLGVCLGGQLLAHVGGGTVEGDVGAPENGSTPVRLRPAAHDDALFHDLPNEIPAMQHHVDAITRLPPDAVWLAESQRCPYQAFRVGPRAWGMQFHPEVLPDRILSWDADSLRKQGFDAADLHARAVRDEPVSTPVWREVARRFASVVAGDGYRIC